MVDTDAAAKIDAITRLQLAMMKGAGTGHRGQHPRQHGCVKAQFEVLADLPDRLKVGLFAKPATYTAYVRFSNGRVLDDTEPRHPRHGYQAHRRAGPKAPGGRGGRDHP